MSRSHTQWGGHFYSSGSENLQVPLSNFSGEIPGGPNDELFPLSTNTIPERQRRDTNDSDAARQSPSESYAVLPDHAAISLTSPPIQGSSNMGPQTTFNFYGIPPPSDMMIITQQPYQGGLPLDYLRAVPSVYYGGFNLQNAFAEYFGGLQDSDHLAWADDIQLPCKLAVVFRFPGYPMYKHQVTVLRAHHQPPTRKALARIVAREMQKFLDRARTEYRQPFRWQGRELFLSDMFLIDVEQVSRGSLQPRIGTRGNTGGLTRELVPRLNFPLPPGPSIAY